MSSLPVARAFDIDAAKQRLADANGGYEQLSVLVIFEKNR